MLGGAFEAFDMDRDEKLNTKDWEVFRAMMASENGLLAIKMGGKGDQTATAIRWRYTKPVPQVPSTLLYKGVLYMINDSGILLSFDPATGNVIKQGRLHGAIDKYFASPVAADDKVFLIGQGGQVSVLKAAGEWEILKVNELDDEVLRRRRSLTAGFTSGLEARCIVLECRKYPQITQIPQTRLSGIRYLIRRCRRGFCLLLRWAGVRSLSGCWRVLPVHPH